LRKALLVGSVALVVALSSHSVALCIEPDVDYVRQNIVVRFLEAYMPSETAFTPSPPVFGIVGLDELLQSCGADSVHKLTPEWDRATSTSARSLERTFIVFLPASADAQDFLQAFESRPEFDYVDLDWIMRVELAGTKRSVPIATAFANQWHLDRDVYNSNHPSEMPVVAHADIDAPEAWAIETGDPNVVIGVIDTGTMMDTTGALTGAWRIHSDFNFLRFSAEDTQSPGIINGADFGCQYNFSDDDGDGVRDNIVGHGYLHGYGCGTANHVSCPSCVEAGFDYKEAVFHGFPVDWILETDPVTFQTLSWTIVEYGHNGPHGVRVASIAAAKLAGNDIVGVAPDCTVYPVRNIGGALIATNQMIDQTVQHCKVINMSWNIAGTVSPAFRDAVRTAVNDSDCVLVASTGNEGGGTNGVRAPADIPEVVAVGAIHKRGYATSYSSWNTTESRVDLMAPVGHGVFADSHTGQFGGPPVELEEITEYTDDGTSYAAPQVAGVAALIRSRFPGLNQADTRARLENSAQYYWATSVDSVRRYGKGKVNAYRALTEWGSISGNVTWAQNSLGPIHGAGSWTSRVGSRDGVYYVSGDLEVESGAQLTIDPGVIVRVAPDHLQAGPDAARVKITVKSGGTLNIAGTLASPVTFESFTDAAPGQNDWSGIEFEVGSSGSISNAIFRNAGRALTTRIPITLSNVTVEDGIAGIDSYANLTATNSIFRDLGSNAIVVRGGNLTTNNIEIRDCDGYGISDTATHGSVSIDDSYIHDLGGYGIILTHTSGAITIENSVVERSETTGILLAVNAGIDRCAVRDNDIGLWLLGGPSAITVSHSTIRGNTTTGIYALGSVVATLQADTVTNSPVGVFFDSGSNGTISDNSLIQSNSAGVKCDGATSPTIRHTRITANTNGVAALNNSSPDLGAASGGSGCGATGTNMGNNSIYSNSGYHVSNLSTGVTIVAEGNWWNTNPPKASKFYGSVDRDPWICSDPNPVASRGEDRDPPGPAHPVLPTNYSLGPSQPNPFNPVTTMTFDVPAPGGHVEISVFDVKGAKIQTLVSRHHEAGTHQVTWSGRSNSGDPVASGVYFVRMTAPSFTQTRKLVLLK
jgi:subtilisin family serine protease